MTTPIFLANFNGVGGTLLTAYQPDIGVVGANLKGSFALSSTPTQVVPASGAVGDAFVWDAGAADMDLSGNCSGTGGGSEKDAVFLFRCTDINNFWWWYFDWQNVANNFQLLHRIAGTDTSVKGVQYNGSSGTTYLFRVTCIGNVYTLYMNGAMIFQYTDTTNFNRTATKFGLLLEGTSGTLGIFWGPLTVYAIPYWTVIQSLETSGAAVAVLTGLSQALTETAGHLLIVFVASNALSADTPTISDTLGNVWVAGPHLFSGSTTLYMFYCNNSVTGANTITVKPSLVSNMEMVTIEVLRPPTIAIDGTATNSGSAVPVTTGSITVNYQADFVLGLHCLTTASAPTWTPTAGFTLIYKDTAQVQSDFYLAVESIVASASQTSAPGTGAYAGAFVSLGASFNILFGLEEDGMIYTTIERYA